MSRGAIAGVVGRAVGKRLVRGDGEVFIRRCTDHGVAVECDLTCTAFHGEAAVDGGRLSVCVEGDHAAARCAERACGDRAARGALYGDCDIVGACRSELSADADVSGRDVEPCVVVDACRMYDAVSSVCAACADKVHGAAVDDAGVARGIAGNDEVCRSRGGQLLYRQRVGIGAAGLCDRQLAIYIDAGLGRLGERYGVAALEHDVQIGVTCNGTCVVAAEGKGLACGIVAPAGAAAVLEDIDPGIVSAGDIVDIQISFGCLDRTVIYRCLSRCALAVLDNGDERACLACVGGCAGYSAGLGIHGETRGQLAAGFNGEAVSARAASCGVYKRTGRLELRADCKSAKVEELRVHDGQRLTVNRLICCRGKRISV